VNTARVGVVINHWVENKRDFVIVKDTAGISFQGEVTGKQGKAAKRRNQVTFETAPNYGVAYTCIAPSGYPIYDYLLYSSPLW